MRDTNESRIGLKNRGVGSLAADIIIANSNMKCTSFIQSELNQRTFQYLKRLEQPIIIYLLHCPKYKL